MLDSLAVLKKIRNIQCKCKCDFLYYFWVYTTRIPSRIFFKDFALSVDFSKIADLTYQTFCLGLLRLFVVNFCLFTTETAHSRDILLPDILLSVLQFFKFYLILPSFALPNLKFFLLLYFVKFNINFILKICGMFISKF